MRQIGSDRPRCVCSTVGFERQLWREHYYPDECPADWQVAYFMNDFGAVYLAAADWFENYGLIDKVVEELEDNFELVLQWPATITPKAMSDALEWIVPLEKNIACMVLPADAKSVAQLKQSLQILAGRYAVNLDCTQPVSVDVYAIAQEFKAGFVWRGDNETQYLMMGDYQLVVAVCPDLRRGTAMLKVLQNIRDEGSRIGVFLEADLQSPQRALELRTVIELLGMD